MDEIIFTHTFVAKYPLRERIYIWLRKHLCCPFGKHRMMSNSYFDYETRIEESYEYCLDCSFETDHKETLHKDALPSWNGVKWS